MAKGSIFAAEGATTRDRRTGATVRQITSHRSIHHHPFYYIPAYADNGKRLFFLSHRTGKPQIFFEDGAGGPLVQLTDRPDLNEWSIHPNRDGRFVYFTAGTCGWRVDTTHFKEEQIAHFGDVEMGSTGLAGRRMGTTSLSGDGRWWCVPVQGRTSAQMTVVDTRNGDCTRILERDSIDHPQFHPDDSQWLHYAGPYTDRIWVIRRDGSDHRLVYEREVAQKEWIVHETWVPGSREIVTVNWPRGIMGIQVDTGKIRWIARLNAWHPMVSPDGSMLITDTKNPDRGLVLINLGEEECPTETVCFPESSSEGDHWNIGHCPYDDGPVAVRASQHTHPHPSFSPDGSRIVWTSDQTGFAQVYEVELVIEESWK